MLSEILLILRGSLAVKLVGLLGLYLCSTLYTPSDFADYYRVIAIIGLGSPLVLLGQQYLLTDNASPLILKSSNTASVLSIGFLGIVLYLVDFSMILVVLVGTYLQGMVNLSRLEFLVREKLPKFLSLVLIGAVFGEVFKVYLGALTVDHGMIYGHLISVLPAAIYVISPSFDLKMLGSLLLNNRIKLSARLFATSVQNFSIQLIPIVLTSASIDTSSVGKFLLALAIVAMPFLVFGKYLNDLFYVRFSKSPGQAQGALFRLLLFYITLLVVYQFFTMNFDFENVFEFLGEKWLGIGLYIQVLGYLAFAQLMMNPILQYYYQSGFVLASYFNLMRLGVTLFWCILIYNEHIGLVQFGFGYSISLLCMAFLLAIYHIWNLKWR